MSIDPQCGQHEPQEASLPLQPHTGKLQLVTGAACGLPSSCLPSSSAVSPAVVTGLHRLLSDQMERDSESDQDSLTIRVWNVAGRILAAEAGQSGVKGELCRDTLSQNQRQ